MWLFIYSYLNSLLALSILLFDPTELTDVAFYKLINGIKMKLIEM